jgi:hypothetical protein
MKKNYTSPALTEYGDIADLTAIFGSEMTEDVLVNPAGNVVQTGTGSLDACPTRNPNAGGMCEINP